MSVYDRRFWILLCILFTGIGLALFLQSLTASAAPALNICPVPSETHATIQSAVDDPACELLHLQPDTFVENVVISRSLTVEGIGRVRTTVDGNASGPVFTIHPGAAVTLAHLEITNGVGDAHGGGIYSEGHLTLVGVAVHDNSALIAGGGIHAHSGALTVTGSIVEDNSAAYGGGIDIYLARVTLLDTVVAANEAANAGGGIQFIGNGPREPQQAASLTIMDSTIRDNSAGTAGGGLANGGRATILASTLSGNQAPEGSGGGIHASAVVTLANTTLSHNAAATGGGLYGMAHLFNATVVSNTARSGAGLASNQAHSISLANTVVAHNGGAGGGTGGGATANCPIAPLPNPVQSLGHNIASDDSCVLDGPGDQINLDPRLGPLAANGGPTFTHALLFASPALDAGDDAICAAAPVAAVDQRGMARPWGTHCDVGAFEAQGPMTAPHTHFMPLFGGA